MWLSALRLVRAGSTYLFAMRIFLSHERDSMPCLQEPEIESTNAREE